MIHPDLKVGDLCRISSQNLPGGVRSTHAVYLYTHYSYVSPPRPPTLTAPLSSPFDFRTLVVDDTTGPLLYLGPDSLNDQIHSFWYEERRWIILDLAYFEVVPWGQHDEGGMLP